MKQQVSPVVIVVVLLVVAVGLFFWFRKAATGSSNTSQDRLNRVIAEDKARVSGQSSVPGAQGGAGQNTPAPGGGR